MIIGVTVYVVGRAIFVEILFSVFLELFADRSFGFAVEYELVVHLLKFVDHFFFLRNLRDLVPFVEGLLVLRARFIYLWRGRRTSYTTDEFRGCFTRC